MNFVIKFLSFFVFFPQSNLKKMPNFIMLENAENSGKYHSKIQGTIDGKIGF